MGLMHGNLKEYEEQIASLGAENENWKAKCLEIETEWSEKYEKILQNLEKIKLESLNQAKATEKDSSLTILFLLMIEIERLNNLTNL